MSDYRWLSYALLSAFAAAFVGIFGKLGMAKIDSTLATAVRSVVMTLFLVVLVSAMGLWKHQSTVRGWPLVSVVLSGLAGALSWLFYFRAIQLGTVSQVAPIDKLSMPLAVLLAVLILGDRPSWVNWVGVLLIAGGAYLAAWPRPGVKAAVPVEPQAARGEGVQAGVSGESAAEVVAPAGAGRR